MQSNSIEKIIEDINQIDNGRYKNQIVLNQLQVSKIIGVSSSSLEKWRKEGIGIEWKKVGGRILYPKISIAKWLLQTIKTI
jgi:hypothetical protein